METNTETKPDAIAALANLTASQVQERIHKLEAELSGLRPLLRSLRARERASQTSGGRTHGR